MAFDYSGIHSTISGEIWAWGLPENRGKTIEYELRIGLFKGKFVPGVSRDDFFAIMDNLTEEHPLTRQAPSRETVEYYGDGTRRITRNGVVELIKKKSISKSVAYQTDFSVGEWTVRQSLSEETRLRGDIPAGSVPEVVKDRNSTSFVFPTYRIDMRETLPSGPYEVEIEFADNAWSVAEKNVHTFLTPLSHILEMITDRRIAISMTDKFRAMNNYHRVFGKRDQKSIFFPIKKPVSLRRSNLKSITTEPFCILPKIDGVRYFLYFAYGEIYAVNYNTFMLVEKFDFPSSWNGRILDGEFYQGSFYAFDCIFENGNTDKGSASYADRHRVILDTAAGYRGVSPVPYYENLLEGLVEISTRSPYELDGVIFTPVNKGYNIVNYKFKPIELLTIDFKTRKTEERTYELYSGDARTREMVLFKGTRTIPFSGKVEVSEEDEELIMGEEAVFEFKWNGSTFYPYRRRYDKLFPNDITVAVNIWEEIHDPVEIKELVMSLSKTPELPKEVDLNLIVTGLGGKPKIEVEVEEEFNFDKLVWDQKEIIKTMILNGRSVIINRDGTITWDDDDGNLRTTFWKDYMKGEEALEEKEAEAVPVVMIPGFEKIIERVTEKYEKVVIDGETFDMKRFRGETAIFDATLYAAIPSFREKSKSERDALSERLKRAFGNEYQIFLYKLTPEMRRKVSQVFSQIREVVEKTENKDVIKLKKPTKTPLGSILKKSISEPQLTVLEILFSMVSREELDDIVTRSQIVRDIPRMIRDRVYQIFRKIPDCIPEVQIKFVQKKIFKEVRSIILKILNNERGEMLSMGEFLMDRLRASFLLVSSEGIKMLGERSVESIYVMYGDDTNDVGVVGQLRQKVFTPMLASSLKVEF